MKSRPNNFRMQNTECKYIYTENNQRAWNRGQIISECKIQNANTVNNQRAWNRGQIISDCKIQNANTGWY